MQAPNSAWRALMFIRLTVDDGLPCQFFPDKTKAHVTGARKHQSTQWHSVLTCVLSPAPTS
jgi:hypothetical protein